MEKDYYAKAVEFGLSTKKLSISEVKDLNHPFLQEIPAHLYKYRKSGSKGRIEFYVGKRKIYTASLNNLNDKFEGVTPATKNRILNMNGESMCRYYKESIIQILKNRFKSLDAGLASSIFDTILEERFDTDAIYKRVVGFVKDIERKQLKSTISSLTYLFKSMDTEMDKNSEFSHGMELLMNINDEMGAFCMCDSCTNENLWALYSDEFKGYCIEYDFTEPCRSKGSIRTIQNLFPVTYVKKKDDDWFKPLFESTIATINVDGKANPFNSGLIFNNWMLRTVCSKKSTWSNEKEWRILGNANMSYLGPLVSSIIVGHNISREDFMEIKRFSDKNGFQLKITDIDYENQEVIVRVLEEEDIQKIME